MSLSPVGCHGQQQYHNNSSSTERWFRVSWSKILKLVRVVIETQNSETRQSSDFEFPMVVKVVQLQFPILLQNMCCSSIFQFYPLLVDKTKYVFPSVASQKDSHACWYFDYIVGYIILNKPLFPTQIYEKLDFMSCNMGNSKSARVQFLNFSLLCRVNPSIKISTNTGKHEEKYSWQICVFRSLPILFFIDLMPERCPFRFRVFWGGSFSVALCRKCTRKQPGPLNFNLTRSVAKSPPLLFYGKVRVTRWASPQRGTRLDLGLLDYRYKVTPQHSTLTHA